MTATPLVYIVDDDASMRASLLRLLGAAGYEARPYGSTGEFLLDPLPDRSGCLLLDVLLPGPLRPRSAGSSPARGRPAAGDIPYRPPQRCLLRANNERRRDRLSCKAD